MSALLGLSSGACGASTDASLAATDAALSAGTDAETEKLDPPSCNDDQDLVTCRAGTTCEVTPSDGVMRCVPSRAGIAKPCGAISCGWMCACADPAASQCHCYSDSGPLPPPDLPISRG